MKDITKSICTIVFLLILIIACMFAIGNARETSTIKVKKIDLKGFDKTRETKIQLIDELIDNPIIIENIASII